MILQTTLTPQGNATTLAPGPTLKNILNPSPVMAFQVSFPGPQGGRGPAGDASVLYQCLAPIALGGHRLVRFYTGIKPVDLAMLNEAMLLTGITTNAAGVGDPLEILLQGPITEPSWSWIPGPVYATTDGGLTQTVPISGILFCIGMALDATTLFFNPKIPLILSE